MQDPVSRLDALEQDAGAFDFFAALRLLECAHPQHPRIGQSLRPRDEAVRFGQVPSLAFTPAMLARMHPGTHGRPYHLDVNFFGLMGANGPLPQHLTDYVRDRERNAGDATLARFFDMFHHRMIALFYRAWASAQPTVSLDRVHGDRFADYLASVIGLGTPALRARDALPDTAKLHYAGLLASHNRNADALAQLLSDYFKVPVAIEQFVGHWMHMPDDAACRLRTGGMAVLGASTVIGRRVWNCQHKFRVVIGPLDLLDYQRLLPGGASFARLRDWVRNYAGMAYEWDIKLQLKRAAVPPLKLGQARTGWTSWLHSAAPRADACQAVFHPHHAVQPNERM
ncbi:type VI secretion system baseplate subunit TssG [Massilia sp. S19_KUP03_FR1]|uniref:type VI secretion system baseplate subunit TssG n=1 Tax=Massilia sp. S19_KUP03_FR1 TaxID=3025503 RepID=UPI002FCD9B29